MNILVHFLREHADVLPVVDSSEEVSFRSLADLCDEDDRLGPLLRAANLDSLIASELANSFAGVVTLQEWNEARETEVAEWASPRIHSEWVTLIPVPGQKYGVTLPDDRLPDLRVSLFTRREDVVRRVSVVVIPGERPTLELRLAGGECGLPYRGTCGGGSCGECRLAWVGRRDEPAGYACRCEDDSFNKLGHAVARTDADVVEALASRLFAKEADYA